MSTEADTVVIKKIPHGEALILTIYQDVKKYLGITYDFSVNTRLRKLGLGSKKSLARMFEKFEKDHVGLFCQDLKEGKLNPSQMTFKGLVGHITVW
ncbi:MAG TPA: hypothetical protein PLJ58_00900 [bacterium]|nr:hypothetical protein [bacterium]